MADVDMVQVDTAMQSLEVNGTGDAHTTEISEEQFHETWGFALDELYRIALTFYKEKEGKAMHLSYKDKLRLVALTKQVSHGKYRIDVSPDVGFLDVVGNDRRHQNLTSQLINQGVLHDTLVELQQYVLDFNFGQAWQLLGDMSRDGAMMDFIQQLNALCPLFKPYVDAHKAEKEEQEQKRQEEEERRKRDSEDQQRQKLESDIKEQQEQDRQKQQQQELQIRAALNQQTAIQFKQYAEQQYPGNQDQQEILIRQLQEQHYQQYMQQVYQQQLLHQQQQYQQLAAMAAQKDSQVPPPPVGSDQEVTIQSETSSILPAGPQILGQTQDMVPQLDGQANHIPTTNGTEQEEEGEDNDQNDLPPIAAASMWTRKDFKEFKDSIRKDADSVIKVGSGETVTVRVPTHEDGTCLFWEFATDSYDLGFGVYFEWTIAPSNQVSVHVSESSDEEDLEDEDGAAAASPEGKGDIEKGSGSKKDNRPPTDEIIPVYRRDCHEEVYCGSHMYPGRGVYLLKFDNSYSLWRSKTLYYRVYYTR